MGIQEGKKRQFYHIDRRQLVKSLSLTEKLPQNDKLMEWKDIEVFNTPKEWISGDKAKGYLSTLTLDDIRLGTLDVRLLPFTPSYITIHGGVRRIRVKSSSHRLQVKCPKCQKWMFFGRFEQHYDTTSCRTGTYKPPTKHDARKF